MKTIVCLKVSSSSVIRCLTKTNTQLNQRGCHLPRWGRLILAFPRFIEVRLFYAVRFWRHQGTALRCTVSSIYRGEIGLICLLRTVGDAGPYICAFARFEEMGFV